MKSTKSIVFPSLLLILVAGCASTVPEDDNNNTSQNNNNHVVPTDGGTTGCQATCTDSDYICVGIPNHQTCAPKCDPGLVCNDSTKMCCYGGCVDTQNDPNNCGSCASYCNGNCVNATCVDQCGNSCGTDTCCGGTCVNTDTNVNFCGDCETQCSSEVANACTNGYCTCGGGAACTGGRKCCTTSCKDLTNDVTNCGLCGKSCGIGETCAAGTCSCNGTTCTFGQGCCGGQCVNLTTDQYCGSCTVSCSNGNTCNNGQCNCAGETCAAGQLPGQDATCCGTSGCVKYDFGLGTTNCGSCGNNCSALELCMMGQCMTMGG